MKINKYLRRRGALAGVMLLVLAVGLGFTSINAYASIAGARNAALAMAFALEAYGYSFVDGDAGLLPQGGSQVVSVTLYKNNTYVMIAGGCEDAYDVDLVVYDDNGRVVGRDTDNSPVAATREITPRWTGTFYIKVTMYNSTWNGAHYVLLLGRR